MNPYTVVGIFRDNLQRTSEHVLGVNAADAELKARRSEAWKDHEILVAGVYVGHLIAVDSGETGDEWPNEFANGDPVSTCGRCGDEYQGADCPCTAPSSERANVSTDGAS